MKFPLQLFAHRKSCKLLSSYALVGLSGFSGLPVVRDGFVYVSCGYTVASAATEGLSPLGTEG